MQDTAIATKHHRLLSLLLPTVEAAGMTLSPDRYIRLQRLWRMLPDDCSVDALRNILCPIFATDERQQDAFADAFERIVQQDLELPAIKPSADIPKEPEKETPKPQETPKTDLNPEPSSSETPKTTTQTRQSRYPLVADLDRCTEPPYSWNIAPKDHNAEINIGEGFSKTLLQLRRREWADHTDIDVPNTIKATIAQGGMPNFRYKRKTRPPEYLLLVERFSRNDHRAGLFDYVFQALRANEVFVERFFYDSDPRINRNEQYPAGLNLNELRNRFPDARLVLLGSGYRLLSPRTGKLAEWALPLQSWGVRALLTPVPHAEWGYQERQLNAAFLLLPASVESLQYIAETPDTGEVQYELLPDYLREIAETEPINLQDPIMRSLRQHFDSGMLCWIAACAVYPALHFDLTLQLGKVISQSLGYNLVTAPNLLALSRLTWFTSGRIPVPVRTELMKYMEQRHPERRILVLAYLRKLMEENPPTNENSVAYAEHRVNLAVIKAMTEETDSETVAELRMVVKRLDKEAGWGDFVLPEVWGLLIPDFNEPLQLVNIELEEKTIDEKIASFLIMLGEDEISTLLIELVDFDNRLKTKVLNISKNIDVVNNLWMKRLCSFDEFLDNKEVSLRELLSLIVNYKKNYFTIIPEIQPIKIAQEPVKVFISYSRKDSKYVDDAIKGLSPLVESKTIDLWIDKDIQVGEDWNTIIKNQINTCELAIFMVSADFFASNFAIEMELKGILSRAEKGDVKILPVVLRQCDFSPFFKKHQVFPKDYLTGGIAAVNSFLDEDEPWFYVSKEVHQIVKEINIEKQKKKLQLDSQKIEVTPQETQIETLSLLEYLQKTKELIEIGDIDDVKQSITYFKENAHYFSYEILESATMYENDFLKGKKVKNIAILKENFTSYLDQLIIDHTIYRCLIIDQLEAPRKFLETIFINTLQNIEVIGHAESVLNAYKIIVREKPNLVIMDIQLRGGTCFDLLKMLRNENLINFDIIFHTGWSPYDLESIMFSDFGFLLKPASIQEIIDQLRKLNPQKNLELLNQQIDILLDNTSNNSIVIELPKNGKGIIKIENIVFLQVDDRLTCFHCNDGTKKISSKSLDYYDKILEKKHSFYRISNNITVNLNYISYFNKKEETITLKSGKTLICSRRRFSDFKKFLGDKSDNSFL
jgi:DNA-binding LytR/AlgR family response regulator